MCHGSTGSVPVSVPDLILVLPDVSVSGIYATTFRPAHRRTTTTESVGLVQWSSDDDNNKRKCHRPAVWPISATPLGNLQGFVLRFWYASL